MKVHLHDESFPNDQSLHNLFTLSLISFHRITKCCSLKILYSNPDWRPLRFPLYYCQVQNVLFCKKFLNVNKMRKGEKDQGILTVL